MRVKCFEEEESHDVLLVKVLEQEEWVKGAGCRLGSRKESSRMSRGKWAFSSWRKELFRPSVGIVSNTTTTNVSCLRLDLCQANMYKIRFLHQPPLRIHAIYIHPKHPVIPTRQPPTTPPAPPDVSSAPRHRQASTPPRPQAAPRRQPP